MIATRTGTNALNDLCCIYWRIAEDSQPDVFVCYDLVCISLSAVRRMANPPFSVSEGLHLVKQ
jgi:hypothetical protein